MLDDQDYNSSRIHGGNITFLKAAFGFFKPRNVFRNVLIEFKHLNGTAGSKLALFQSSSSGIVEVVGCVIKAKMGGQSQNSLITSEEKSLILKI